MKRPARIRVLGKPITVHYVPAGDEKLKDGPEDTEPGMGRSDGSKQEIAVEEGQPLETEQDTLLHEVLHIIEEYMGMDVPEGVVEVFATGLLAVLKDNPSFGRYLAARKR